MTVAALSCQPFTLAGPWWSIRGPRSKARHHKPASALALGRGWVRCGGAAADAHQPCTLCPHVSVWVVSQHHGRVGVGPAVDRQVGQLGFTDQLFFFFLQRAQLHGQLFAACGALCQWQAGHIVHGVHLGQKYLFDGASKQPDQLRCDRDIQHPQSIALPYRQIQPLRHTQRVHLGSGCLRVAQAQELVVDLCGIALHAIEPR